MLTFLVQVQHRLVRHHQQVPVVQREGVVRATAVRRAPVAMGDQFRRRLVLHVQYGQSTVAPRAVGEVVHYHRMMQGVAVLPGRRLAGGSVHAGDPPAAHFVRACRVGHVDDHQDMVGEPVEQRRGIGIAAADPPDAMQAETWHLHRADLSRIGRIGDVVDIHSGGVVLATLAEAAAVHLAGAAIVLLLRQQVPADPPPGCKAACRRPPGGACSRISDASPRS